MFSHAQMWAGIDRLAKHHGLTPSGLARKAGLDPTTFNPSKRTTKENKQRWPSTESLAKVLDATNTPFDQFVMLVNGGTVPEPAPPPEQRLRCIGLDQADRPGLFDESGFPQGEGWDEVDFPNVDDRHAFALEVRGDAFEPLYRDGDLLIVSPIADVRRRDRILVRSRDGTLLGGVLRRRTAQRLEIDPFGADVEPHALALNEVDWLARIVWASQ